MQRNSGKTINDFLLLPKCLCEIDLPHSAQHASQFPQQIMPTLKLEDTALKTAQKHRADELMLDLKTARAGDIELKNKFEQRAQKLLQELKDKPDDNKEKFNQWIDDQLIIENKDRLKYQLEHSRFQLADVRNQLHSLKKTLNIYRRLVKQEVGSDMSLHEILTNKKWKGRSEEIQNLKNEIANMEAKAFDHKYLRNPLCIPEYHPRFPRVEDLIPLKQAEYLKMEVIKRKEKDDDLNKEVTSFMREYGDIAIMYKASVTHNKILAEELQSLKEQYKLYEQKSKEDIDLIKKLVNHQMQMREMLDQEAYLIELVGDREPVKPTNEEEKLDSTKYKTLWETSEYQKQSLLQMLHLLTNRLDKVMERTEEAERHCQQNQSMQDELEEVIEKKKAEVKATKMKKAKGGKTERANESPMETQLRSVMEENEFLRSILHNEIELKEKDLELYKLTMNDIRQQYLKALEKIQKKDVNSALTQDSS